MADLNPSVDKPFPDGEPLDITALVCEAMEIDAEDIANHIFDIYVDGHTLIVKADYCISTFELFGRDQCVERATYKFQDPIDLFSFGYGLGFIRAGNKLYFTGAYHTYTHYEKFGSRYEDICEIAFDDTPGIHKIICFGRYVLLLMDDGCVYYSNIPRGSTSSCSYGAFIQIEFYRDCSQDPVTERIVKIVSDQFKIIYISVEGSCYYTDTYGKAGNLVLRAELLQSVAALFVTDAFILSDSIVIQYDHNRLCSMFLVYRKSGRGPECLNAAYMDGSKQPIDVPSCGDEPIVSVIKTLSYVYLTFVYVTTASGRVYRYEDGNNSGFPTVEPVSLQFFEDNPVAVPRDPVVMIASALSVIDRDD